MVKCARTLQNSADPPDADSKVWRGSPVPAVAVVAPLMAPPPGALAHGARPYHITSVIWIFQRRHASSTSIRSSWSTEPFSRTVPRPVAVSYGPESEVGAVLGNVAVRGQSMQHPWRPAPVPKWAGLTRQPAGHEHGLAAGERHSDCPRRGVGFPKPKAFLTPLEYK